jgi:hypothetical protein
MALQGAYLSYPTVPGSRLETESLVTGPASYTQVTMGSGTYPAPPTAGGLVVKASDLGLNEVEAIVGTPTTDTGAHFLIPLPGGDHGAPQTSIRFMIGVSHTGAELAAMQDLSARKFLIRAIGS